MIDFLADRLNKIEKKGNLRVLPELKIEGKYVYVENRCMLNLSSNDYLGLASSFYSNKDFDRKETKFASSSSRLLTGNSIEYRQLENRLSELYYSRAVLLFNSGYHANIGILPAITTRRSLILADKLVHASIIDGIRLSEAKCIRFKHNDLNHLNSIVEREFNNYDIIVIVVESIYSMDGDISDLKALVKLKNKYDNIVLYVDEAHAVGVRGKNGLGCAEEQNVIPNIDFLIGTFGKALASYGAYVVCDEKKRNFLINTARSFIFSTALPSVNLRWSLYMLNKAVEMKQERMYLNNLSIKVHTVFNECVENNCSFSHIIPFIIGDSHRCSLYAKEIQKEGFYILPVRPPTVPEGTSRLRISLTAACTENEIDKLLSLMKNLDKNEIHIY
ncbi:aminotransferase class I/II-fold pyridoxal phosphate-dependent enzyme [Coprobacter tertius]|uniref:8-amino-7-oxononanoate synthase n=1 Tax=Coprobacter tertius TaxID=2944915 RepID=A0ABT1MHF7_9BACT|nr:8-amino-7-oxononanoate synthase [Coprobacter tertius]MCP9612079.1 8-amino-7-oxononanoate synthase [Coprobacter tertius]